MSIRNCSTWNKGHMRNYLLLAIILLFSLGCRRIDANSHLQDLIYLDLKKEQAAAASLAAEAAAKILDLEKDLAKTRIRSIDRINVLNDLKNQNKLKNMHTEKIEYYEIRSKLRELEGRRLYLERFQKNEPWPDNIEFDAYMTNKRLRQASKNWNSRVPKPQHVLNSTSAVAPKTDTAAEE